MGNKKKREPSFVVFFIASIGLHGLVVALLFALNHNVTLIDLNKKPIKTSLVSRVLPIEKDLMPRKIEKEIQTEPESKSESSPKPTSKPKPESKLESKPAPEAFKPKEIVKAVEEKKPTKKMDVKDRLNKLARSFERSNTEALISSQELEGEIADSYLLHVQELIKEAFEVPAILSFEERKKLKLMARIYIDAQGKLITLKLERPSGNHTFDNAVERASKSILSFGAPPLQLRTKLQKQGEVVSFCPLECR